MTFIPPDDPMQETAKEYLDRFLKDYTMQYLEGMLEDSVHGAVDRSLRGLFESALREGLLKARREIFALKYLGELITLGVLLFILGALIGQRL